jgi:hypothetical protein
MKPGDLFRLKDDDDPSSPWSRLYGGKFIVLLEIDPYLTQHKFLLDGKLEWFSSEVLKLWATMIDSNSHEAR